MTDGLFHQNVDFTGAQINGELRLVSSMARRASWQGKSLFILRNAKADAIQDLQDAWPPRLDLSGFTYRGLGGANVAGRDPLAARRVEWFADWLGKQDPYDPAPYEQLTQPRTIERC